MARASTSERGYGAKHQALRRRWAPVVKRGEAVCARCGKWIPADPSVVRCPRCGRFHLGWDLGHDDRDRSVWSGPEHECCNRGTATHRMRRRVERVVSRADWW